MTAFAARDPDYEPRVRESFARQRVMELLGATLLRVAPGEVDIELPFRDDLTQQHGYLHAGIVSTIADSACGYAAMTLAPPDSGVLTIEYKVNLLAPASGSRMIARGRVTRSGRTITVCAGDVYAAQPTPDGASEREVLIATMLATVMTIRERPGANGD